MAKEEKPYTISARQLFAIRNSRDVIDLTLSADLGLGKGIPLGSTVLLGGKFKSGKTSIALQYAANAQKKYGAKIFFANVEGRLDNKILSQVQGIDLDNFEVIMGPPIYDQNKKIVGNKKMTAEEWWDRIGEIISNNRRSVIIVDSISSLSDESELSEKMGHMSRGMLQRLEAQFKRKYGDIIIPSEITLFLLAEIQANTSGLGESIQMKCGNALRHIS